MKIKLSRGGKIENKNSKKFARFLFFDYWEGLSY